MRLIPRHISQRTRNWARWLIVLVLIWAIQLIWLYDRLGRPNWGEYWQMRGWYRPGIQVVDATGGEYLPEHVLNPLSPAGATWAFVLAAGVYALLATCIIWAVWRAGEKRRRRAMRSFRRAVA